MCHARIFTQDALRQDALACLQFSATILRCHNRATGANATDVREVAALSPMYQILQGILTELAVPDSGCVPACKYDVRTLMGVLRVAAHAAADRVPVH